MSVDLTGVPWSRLSKLAPPDTTGTDLQEAADRWALRADVYAAAADLWEDKAMLVDMAPDVDGTVGDGTQKVSRVSQDGITVEYADDALAGNNQSTRIAQLGQINARVRYLRSKSKPYSPLVHDPLYDPWTGTFPAESPIIIVDEV